MNESPPNGRPLIDGMLWIWLALTALAVAYVAYDQFKGGPKGKESSLAMTTMKWGWVLVTLYTGLFGFIGYWFFHRASARVALERSEPALWKQSIESSIHCVAGDATGIFIAVFVTTRLRLPMSLDVIAEYFAGFAVGLFVFQALCMEPGGGGNYWPTVKSTLLAETLSMNAMMAGMIPVMVILMSRDMSALEPSSVRFWGIMSLASVVGTATTYPANWWLVKHGLKHGLGGEARALRVGRSVSVKSKLAATFLAFGLLGIGVVLSARYGDFSMRAGGDGLNADSNQSRKLFK